jgi:hypothetical protein
MRLVGTAGTMAVLAAGWNVGHSGGQLVYQHNAGAAYGPAGSTGTAGMPTDPGEERRSR